MSNVIPPTCYIISSTSQQLVSIATTFAAEGTSSLGVITPTTKDSWQDTPPTPDPVISASSPSLPTTLIENLRAAFPHLTTSTLSADVVSNESLARAAHNLRLEIGAWDYLIFIPSPLSRPDASDIHSPTPAAAHGPVSLAAEDTESWWANTFESRIKPIQILAKHFLSKARLPGATLVYMINDDELDEDGEVQTNGITMASLMMRLHKENKARGLRCFTVISESSEWEARSEESGIWGEERKTEEVLLWLTSEEANHWKGRVVDARLGVEGLRAKKGDLEWDARVDTVGIRAGNSG